MTTRVRALVTVLLAAPLAASAALGGPLVPTRASQLVTARTGSGNVPCPFGGGGSNSPYLIDTMIGPDGAERPFAIPPKQVFVVTGFDFNFGGPVAGSTVFVQLTSFDAQGTPAVLAQGTVATGSDQLGGGSVAIPNGVVVHGDRMLCVTGNKAATGGLVHGFFAKDR
jgi:hypothetical protein